MVGQARYTLVSHPKEKLRTISLPTCLAADRLNINVKRWRSGSDACLSCDGWFGTIPSNRGTISSPFSRGQVFQYLVQPGINFLIDQKNLPSWKRGYVTVSPSLRIARLTLISVAPW